MGSAEPRGSPAKIEVDDIGYVYPASGSGDGVTALDGVGFRVGPQEFVSIIGPSGCGKSTVLKIVAGLLSPTSGAVRVGGKSPDMARRERAFGFVFQSPVLLPWRSARDNVALPLEIQGVPVEPRRERARRLLRLVGLEGFENRHPRELSGGMQQRVAIARSLALEPSILLMDEPFGALDAITRDRMGFELLSIWQQSQTAVLFVTHSVSEAVLLSDRVLVMSPRPGRVQRTFSIDLPRPRTTEARLSSEFGDYVRELLRGLSVDDERSSAPVGSQE